MNQAVQKMEKILEFQMKIFALMILGVNFRFIFKKFLVYLLLICFTSCDTFIKEEITGSVYGTNIKFNIMLNLRSNFPKQIDSIFDEIDFSMSTYKSNSVISKINKNEE